MRSSHPAVLLFVVCLFLPACQKRPAVLPSESESKTLALESILAFNQAIQAKDFALFHQQVSALWQKQTTPEELKKIFTSFIDQGIDLSGVSKIEPIFDEPAIIDADRVLVLKGHYPTAPSKVDFQLKYIEERTAWKLIGIKIDVSPSGGLPGELPSEEKAKALALDSLLAFNRAVVEKNFAGFYEQIASVWRQQTTAEKLQDNFQSFIEKEADISPIAKVSPSFAKAPAINDNGLLVLEGSFPTRPQQVYFDLAFIHEAPDWKLVKIKINVSAIGEERGADPVKEE